MYNKALLVSFLVCILSVAGTLPVVNAIEESYEYCINESYKYWEENIYYNGTLHSFNNTKNCTYGCLNGDCLPAQTESHDIAIIIGIMLVAFFFLYAGLKMDKETHGVIQVMFLFVGVMFTIVNFAVLSEISEYSSITPLGTAVNSGYQLTIYVFWFLLFYFMVLFFYKVLVSIGKIQPIKWSL